MSGKNKARNVLQIAVGKIKQATGKRVGNPKLEASGRSDQMTGNLKQAEEKVKDAFEE
ncbi:MAG TPA: CsbD family protein [Acidimicrobiales bacterium]